MDTPTSRRNGTALLIIDMINTFDFVDGEILAAQAAPITERIVRLRDAFAAASKPVVFVNDNFGQWRSDFHALLERCSAAGARGSAIATRLRPGEEDYFILKPKHSAFFASPLDMLLQSLDVGDLVLAGIAGDGCVLATANDAHMRDYGVIVAADATASMSPERNRRALALLTDTQTAQIVTADAAARELHVPARA